MKRRTFIKTVGLGGMGIAIAGPIAPFNKFLIAKETKDKKYWTWITNNRQMSADQWKQSFASMHEAGINAILPQIYNSRKALYESKHLPVDEPWLETILPLAKAEGLEVHAWMWTMPCNIKEIVTNHPDWYVVNRNGESSVTKPAYVNFYKFLCASHPEVHEFIKKTVTELSEIDMLDGVHLDYVRFPDVILPKGLWAKYGIVQDKEYPQYDYCYCDVCRKDYEKEKGIDPMKIKDPAHDGSWNLFRYQRITNLVNNTLIPVMHKHNKKATAAVFPNWRNVRQQWYAWHLDGALPMLYSRAYEAGIEWIREKTEIGVAALPKNIPLYSGLSVSQFEPDGLAKAIDVSLGAGAHGVSLFSSRGMNEEKWKSFAKAVKQNS